MRAALPCLLALSLAACASSSPKVNAEISSPRDPASFYRSMAYTLLRTNQYAQAVQHIQRLLESKPKEAEPHYLMARAMMGMDLLVQVRPEVDRAIALDGKFAPAHSLLGLLLDRQGQHAAAERAHRRALQLDGNAAAYHNNLGFCLYLQRRYGEAVEAYRRALAANPTVRRVHNNLAFAYAGAGDLEQARKHFTIAGDPAQVNNNMGLVYESMGQLEKAYQLYERAAAGGEPVQARQNLARVCARLGRPVPKLETPSTLPTPTGSSTP